MFSHGQWEVQATPGRPGYPSSQDELQVVVVYFDVGWCAVHQLSNQLSAQEVFFRIPILAVIGDWTWYLPSQPSGAQCEPLSQEWWIKWSACASSCVWWVLETSWPPPCDLVATQAAGAAGAPGAALAMAVSCSGRVLPSRSSLKTRWAQRVAAWGELST